MALTYGFYNSINHDRVYDAVQLSSMFDGIISDGVLSGVGDGFAVQATSGMGIKVKTGKAWFNKSWTTLDNEYPLTVDNSETVLSRLDAVVLEINSEDVSSGRVNDIKIVRGTPSANPVLPQMQHTSTLNQYILASVLVGPGVLQITDSNITYLVGRSGGAPFSTAVVTPAFNVENFVQTWNAQFSEWRDNQMEGFTNWLSSIQSQITENQYVQLLEMCNKQKQVKTIELANYAWTNDGDWWTQTVSEDVDGVSLSYANEDHPQIVDALDADSITLEFLKNYNKVFGSVTSGFNKILQNGSIQFFVYKNPTIATIRIGLKGV